MSVYKRYGCNTNREKDDREKLEIGHVKKKSLKTHVKKVDLMNFSLVKRVKKDRKRY